MDTVATLVLRDVWFEAKGDCIGVEAGALAILNAGLTLAYALGDFDSVSEAQKRTIFKEAKDFKVFPIQKDLSDSELAINYCLQKGYQHIYVYGALGQRADHQQVNLSLMFTHPQVVLLDETQEIQAFDLGEHELQKQNHRKFSVFTFTQATIDLKACLYPLQNYTLNPLTRLTLSNEWKGDSATLKVHFGRVYVVKTQ